MDVYPSTGIIPGSVIPSTLVIVSTTANILNGVTV